MTTREADVSQPDSYSTSDSTTTPSEDTDFVAEVRSSVDQKLLNLRHKYRFVPIPRVPDGLRKVNPRCYTPRLVAIGPLHRDIPQLKPMEDMKLSFLQEFIVMENLDMDGIITFIMDEIVSIRYSYEVTENIPQNNDLCEMMLLDSIFIIQIFLMKKRNDHMFDNYWWFRDLMHDFLLIENQIPMYIPDTIYSHHYCQSDGEHDDTDFTNLAINFFKDVKMASYYDTWYLEGSRHFIEYLMRAHFKPLTQTTSNKEGSWKFGDATASRLLEYGVKFEARTNTTSISTDGFYTSLVEIQFKPKDGILTIPRIKVNDWTETLFRNLIAFEHCQHLTPRYVTDYIIFMDSLIDTPEDVKILTKKKIIQDDLQDPEKVSELFNNLYKEVITENRHYYFAQISCQLNDYRRDCWYQWIATWHNWMVILRRNYFNSPWSIISLFAAVILLGLTVVQTVCSIIQA